MGYLETLISLFPNFLQSSHGEVRGDKRTCWLMKLGSAVVKASCVESLAATTKDAAETSNAGRRSLDCILEGQGMLCEYLGPLERIGRFWSAKVEYGSESFGI